MVSGQWLTKNEVVDPEWWHWVRIVVPDSLVSSISLLYIGGGEKKTEEPKDADSMIRKIALSTGAIAIHLHNVPNQPTEFVGDTFGPRYEDELIAYGWRKFMEQGAGNEIVEWLPRLPMTRAAVRAMDAATDYAAQKLGHKIDRFVVAGGSKRGWTTWTTAIADERVIAIAPIVIDLLNIVPSFKHHWKAYGAWSEAVGDYVREDIMEWLGSVEFGRLLNAVEPYSYRDNLQLPKMLINASGDEFFLPDSWQFYWDNLMGEKHIRYVPNTGHSLKDTDADQTLNAFFHSIVTNTPRPEFDWKVEDGKILIKTDPAAPPQKINLWQAVNENARDFRVDVAGKVWTSTLVPISTDGNYQVSVEPPRTGWKAFFVELIYPGPGKYPFKLTTGVVVVPESLPHPEFISKNPKGTPVAGN
jgi:PhoPQ-activated pathogenicity-related protein